MEREANYLAVGSFVLLVLAMGVLFIYWYSSAYRRGNYHPYEIYFDGSVSGLTVGSPVRYLGVDVGQVQSIRIAPRSSQLVQAVVDIDASAPISNQTVARLALQGVTGLLYIDLRQRSGAPEQLIAAPGQKYPVIASEQSSLDRLLSNLPQLTERLTDVLDRSSRLLSDPTIEAFGHIATHLDEATAGLPQTLQSTSELIGELRVSARQANQILSDLHAASRPARTEVPATLQKLRVATVNLANMTARLDGLLADNHAQLASLLRDGLPQLQGLLRDSRTTIRDIDALTRSLREDPSRLLYQPARAGVSIPP